MMYLIGSLTTAGTPAPSPPPPPLLDVLIMEPPIGQKSYAKAGAVALETLTGIRTVSAFGAEERSAKRYEAELAGARRCVWCWVWVLLVAV
jgi:hypothetical protein